ncbi:MAG: hypothetical protein GC161_15165 [Planctomycetaceae bacterium]|nr:hypothetical protein [Planctomycetaceae bacterium]
MMFAQLLAALTLTCLAAAPAQEPAEEPPFRNSVAELQIALATQPHDDIHLALAERLLGHALKWTQTELAAGRVPTATLKGDLTTLLCARADLWIEFGVREDKRTGLVAPPSSFDPALVSPELTALLNELSTRPELLARATALRQSGSAGGIDWLDEVLEPWGATWIRAEFGAVDRDVYDRVRAGVTARGEGSVAERWEVAPLFVLLLQWDCSRVVVDVGPRTMANTLAALAQSAPDKLARFDSASAQRRGAACDEWMLRALSSAASRTVRVPSTLEALTPILARLLGRRDLDLWPSIRNVLSEMRSQRELPPELVRAWSEAVLTADGARARALLEGFGDLQVAVSAPREAQWLSFQPWHTDLFRPLLAHPERDIQLIAGSFFLRYTDRTLLDWATHADVAHRRLAMDVTGTLSSNEVSSAPPAESRLRKAWTALIADADPSLRDQAFEALPHSWILQSEWLRAGLQSSTPAVRSSLADWISERIAARTRPAGLASTQAEWIRSWLQEEPELCAAVFDALAEDLRGRWASGPWNTPELARRELLRLLVEPTENVLRAVDSWLDDSNSPGGAWFDVLAARLRFDHPLRFSTGGVARRLDELGMHTEAMSLASETRSKPFLVHLLQLGNKDRLRSMFAPLHPDDRKWVMVSLWHEAPAQWQTWETLLEAAGDPALVRGLVEDEALPVMLRVKAAPYLTSQGAADDQTLLVLAADLAGSNEGWVSDPAPEKFAFVDPNGALVRWLSTVPFDPSVTSGARITRPRVYQWIAPGQPGVQEALVAVLEDHLALAERGTRIQLPSSKLPAVAAEIRHQVQPRTATLLRNLLVHFPSREAIQLAGGLGVPEAIQGLADFVTGPLYGSARFHVDAIDSLRRFPENDVAAVALRAALLSPNLEVVDAASAALDTWSRYRAAGEANAAVPSEAQAVAELFALLGHAQPALRAEAARGLATLGAAAAIPRLIALLADPDPAVRTAARESLDRLHTRPLAPAPAKDPAPPEDS